MTEEVPPGGATPADAATLRLLAEGELEISGRLVDASNATLFCAVTRQCPDPEPDETGNCIYKPIRGERPLDDFPDGTLANREVAAYLVSEATGWRIVPPTVMRDGPFGPGMAQIWIEVDDEVDVLQLILTRDPALRRMALFDAVVNNADRKGGHMLPAYDGHIHGVDHGVCFSPDPKLRTVLWGWRAEPFEPDEVEVLHRLRAALDTGLGAALRGLLSPIEVRATVRRVERLIAAGSFPSPRPGHRAIPWPPF